MQKHSAVVFCLLALSLFHFGGVEQSQVYGQSPGQPIIPDQVLRSVFLVGVQSDDNRFREVGTAWTISSDYLVTNAHVAQALIKIKTEQDRIVAKRGIFDRNELVLGDIHIHPAYLHWNPRLQRMMINSVQELKTFNYLPVADVALLEITLGNPGPALPVLSTDEAADQLSLGGEVFYIGYPMENLSGFATLHVVAMRITARTDIFFRPKTWHDAHFLHLSGAVTGGASGSPVINRNGQVVGVLSSADHIVLDQDEGEDTDQDENSEQNEPRRIGIGFAYAQKAEFVTELAEGIADERQAERNRLWRSELTRIDTFLTPEAVIDQYLRLAGRRQGFDPDELETITRQTDDISEEKSEYTLNLKMDAGYQYIFVSVATDGTDIDAKLIDSNDEAELEIDTAEDQYPAIFFHNQDDRRQVKLNVYAAEKLLGPTTIHTRVFRRKSDVEQDDAVAIWELALALFPGEVVHEETLITPNDGRRFHRMSFEATQGSRYLISALSVSDRDIDLFARKNGRLLETDDELDSAPVLLLSEIDGKIDIALEFPENSRQGETTHFIIKSNAIDDDSQTETSSGEFPFAIQYTVPNDPPRMVEWTFMLKPDRTYGFFAESKNEFDIDLYLRQDGEVLGSDDFDDYFPQIEITNISGEATLQLILPESITPGDIIDMKAYEQ
jgi:S1-C subfamily serine protease